MLDVEEKNCLIVWTSVSYGELISKGKILVNYWKYFY